MRENTAINHKLIKISNKPANQKKIKSIAY